MDYKFYNLKIFLVLIKILVLDSSLLEINIVCARVLLFTLDYDLILCLFLFVNIFHKDISHFIPICQIRLNCSLRAVASAEANVHRNINSRSSLDQVGFLKLTP